MSKNFLLILILNIFITTNLYSQENEEEIKSNILDKKKLTIISTNQNKVPRLLRKLKLPFIKKPSELPIKIDKLKSLGGGVGNGGDVIKCDWRAPIITDYYESMMLGPFAQLNSIRYNDYSQTSELKSVNDFIDFLKYHEHRGYIDNDEYIKSFKILRKNIKRALKVFPSSQQWHLTPWLNNIDDSNHQYILPKGCQIEQIAVNINGTVYASENLFNQLDQLQRNILFLHELLYHVGKVYYSHQDAFHTRALIRKFLRAQLNIIGGWRKDYDFIQYTKYFIEKGFSFDIESYGDEFVYPYSTSTLDLIGEFKPITRGCKDIMIINNKIYLNRVDVKYDGKLYENLTIDTRFPGANSLSPHQQLFQPAQYLAVIDLPGKTLDISVTKDGYLGLRTFNEKDCKYRRL
jgi:hypothetical protein